MTKILKQLKLTSTKIEIQERYFTKIDNGVITELDLSGLDIEEIPENIFNELPQLRKLDLSFNALEQIDEELFDQLPNLQELNIRGNRIQKIDLHSFSKITVVSSQ